METRYWCIFKLSCKSRILLLNLCSLVLQWTLQNWQIKGLSALYIWSCSGLGHGHLLPSLTTIPFKGQPFPFSPNQVNTWFHSSLGSSSDFIVKGHFFLSQKGRCLAKKNAITHKVWQENQWLAFIACLEICSAEQSCSLKEIKIWMRFYYDHNAKSWDRITVFKCILLIKNMLFLANRRILKGFARRRNSCSNSIYSAW